MADNINLDDELKSFIEKNLSVSRGTTNSSLNPMQPSLSVVKMSDDGYPTPYMFQKSNIPVNRIPYAKEVPMPPPNGIHILGARSGKVEWFPADLCQ